MLSEQALRGLPVAPARHLPPPADPRPWWRRAGGAYFHPWGNAVISLICLGLIGWLLWVLVNWLLLGAVWRGGPEECKAPGTGFCWPFVAQKLRFMIFGFYPAEMQWRPALAIGCWLAGCGLAMTPRCWSVKLLPMLAVLAVGFFYVMAGGPGLEPVPTHQWGGLPLTVMLATVGMVCAYPLGIVLALGRRSALPVIRTLSVLYIEIIRGVPLISFLFMASVMFPLFLPEGVNIDKVLRAQVAIILFAGAYFAEVVRGGLQGIPRGQYEAAQALGLGYWKTMGLIVLPQALRIAIPPTANIVIGFFMDTTLVTIIGLFDFLNTVRAALRDPDWQGIAVAEGYLFAAGVYFVFCISMATYSLFLERRLRVVQH